MRWNFQNYRDFILQTSTLLEQKFTNLYKLKPRGMNSRGPIENLICKMYDFIELWGLWHPIGILNGVFKITNLLKSRVPSVNISSKASSLGTFVPLCPFTFSNATFLDFIFQTCLSMVNYVLIICRLLYIRWTWCLFNPSILT